jgi:hypothetical protein
MKVDMGISQRQIGACGHDAEVIAEMGVIRPKVLILPRLAVPLCKAEIAKSQAKFLSGNFGKYP